MEIRIQAIHFDASEKLEKFIQKKVSKLEQYYDGIIAVEVSLKVVKPETAQNKEAGIKVLSRETKLYFRAKWLILLKKRSMWLSMHWPSSW